MVAGPPLSPGPVPQVLQRVGAGRPLTAVWENEAGGLTYRVDGSTEPELFVKWAPSGSGLDLAAEAVRLSWAASYAPVPRVQELGGDDSGEWLVTRALPGRSAVDPAWVARPEAAVSALGAGLRMLHDRLPVDACPFGWSAGERVVTARWLVAAGTRADPTGWNVEHRGLVLEEVMAALADPPPTDRLVVCHGDACAPNTLLDDGGHVAGHVDLGALGVADRWADLAVATWSTQWNYGSGWEGLLLDSYGIEADAERTRYYRLLWDLGP